MKTGALLAGFAVLLLAGCGDRAAAETRVAEPASTVIAASPSPVPAASSTPSAPPPTATSAPPPPATPTASAAASSTARGSAGAAQVISRGATDRRFVALSFDAGADVGYTTMILDTLRSKGVRVSFGMTGQWAEQHPDLVRRMADEGHDFINHTYDHSSFTGVSTQRGPMSSEARTRQIERTEEIVRSLTGKEMRPYFRPPFGDYDASVNADIARLGFTYNVMWTVDSLGWRGISAPAIVERCLSNASPGAILIFHVGSQSQDGPALGPVIDGLRAQGYSLGSVRELLEG